MSWSSDGTTQALGTCLRDFRNKPYPVRAKITYYKKTLTVGETINTHTLSIRYIFICIYEGINGSTASSVLFGCIMILSSSSGTDQQWIHSRQRGLRILHKGGQYGHSHWGILWHFSCHWWFSRYYSVLCVLKSLKSSNVSIV